MDGNVVELPGFHFVGIYVDTDIERGPTDIALLWERFMKEKVIDTIPEFTSSIVYTLYTKYAPEVEPMRYRALVGCPVRDVVHPLPQHLDAVEIPPGRYTMFLARGSVPQAVSQAWQKIQEMDLSRSYRADWDVYGPKSQNGEVSEVEIFVGVEEN